MARRLSSTDPSVLAYELRGSIPVLSLGSRVDRAVVADLETRVRAALGNERRAIVIDLLDVGEIALDAQVELFAALRRLADGARLTVAVADPRLQWVLETSQIDGLECHATIDSIESGGRSRRPMGPQPLRRGRLASLWQHFPRSSPKES